MATEIVHTLRVRDDRDGTLLDKDEGRRVPFSVGGQNYEMDLSIANEQAFRDALAPWISIARKVGKPDPKLKTKPIGTEEDVVPLPPDAGVKVKTKGKTKAANVERSAPTTHRKPDTKIRDGIRAWAIENGYTNVHPRYGRIAQEVIDHWEREHPELVEQWRQASLDLTSEDEQEEVA